MFMTTARHMWIVIGHCCSVIAEIGNGYAVTDEKQGIRSMPSLLDVETLDTEVTSKVSVVLRKKV